VAGLLELDADRQQTGDRMPLQQLHSRAWLRMLVIGAGCM